MNLGNVFVIRERALERHAGEGKGEKD